MAIEVQGAGTQGAWRELTSVPAAAVAPELRTKLALAGMPGGDYQVRATVCDAAGNSSQAVARLTLPDLVGRSAHAELADLSGVRLLPLTSKEAKLSREVEGALVPVIRTTFGKRFMLRGRLVRRDGQGAAGVAIELGDPAGRFVASARSGTDGTFAFRSRAILGGSWSVVAPGVPELRSSAVLEVTPILRARFLRTSVRAGQAVVVSGVIRPRAVSLGKLVQIQWRDPRRGWRPIANGRVAKDGRIRIAYTFVKGGGYRVAMRLVVPEERGWGFTRVATRAVRVRVR